MKKIIYIVLEGLSDRTIKDFDGKTPLESATTFNLDSLARSGVSGLSYTCAKGIAPESDIAVISLLGYDVRRYYTGRGPLESFAEGLIVNSGDVAFRANFATVSDSGLIKDRRVARDLTTEEAVALAKEINAKITLSGATFEFKNTVGHRGVLVIRGMRSKLSGWVNNTDPAYGRSGIMGIAREKFDNCVVESSPMPGYEDSIEAKETAQILNEFTRKAAKVLNDSQVNKKRIKENKMPANIILCRDGGDSIPRLPQLKDLYGLTFGSFVKMPIEKGIASLAGMELISIPESTGHLDVDYAVWAKIALTSISEYGGVYIHIKDIDEVSHDGDFNKKKEIIEYIDKFFLANILSGLNISDTIIAVTSAHSTVCALKAHSSDPSPFLIAGGSIKPDKVAVFSEKAVGSGGLGEIEATNIMPYLVRCARE